MHCERRDKVIVELVSSPLPDSSRKAFLKRLLAGLGYMHCERRDKVIVELVSSPLPDSSRKAFLKRLLGVRPQGICRCERRDQIIVKSYTDHR